MPISDRETKARAIKRYIEQNSELIKRLVDEIVIRYSRDLDDFVELVGRLLEDIKQGRIREYSDISLEMQTIKLPVLMYFASNGLEDLGAESDIAKANRMERYNEVYVELTGTIPEREAGAGLNTLYEAMMEAVYLRAYKKLKAKIDMADKLFSALKKVLSKRIVEMDISRRELPNNNFDDERGGEEDD